MIGTSFLVGWLVLFIAIILNIAASFLNVDTWYPFLNNAASFGFAHALGQLSLPSIVFLFIIYPLLLGITAVWTLTKLKKKK